MSKRAIVQIGTEKTGSTTIQHFLATNRASLRANGFQYPSFCGAMNHTGLAAYAMAPGRHDSLRTPFGYDGPNGVPAMRERMRIAAASELSADLTAIFCSEHCHGRLVDVAEVATLRDFLIDLFDDVEISVYIRRQDQLAVSLHSTRLKSGGTGTTILPKSGPGEPSFDYDRMLGFWETCFGRDKVHVRLFDRRELTGGDVVSDFVAAWGLAGATPYASVPNQNEALSPLALEFLRRVNQQTVPADDMPADDLRGFLCARLSALFPGRGVRPARAEAEAFYARFRASNEAVRARHFPDRPSLFDEDFSSYPEEGDPSDFALDDFAAVAAALHAAATRENWRLEAEVAIRDARLQLLRDRPAEAERAIARALRWRPRHAEAHRVAAEIHLRHGRKAEALAAAGRAVEYRPDWHEHWHFLGMVRRRCGDLDGAAEAQQRTLALAPDHLGARNELAQVAAASERRHAPSNPSLGASA